MRPRRRRDGMTVGMVLLGVLGCSSRAGGGFPFDGDPAPEDHVAGDATAPDGLPGGDVTAPEVVLPADAGMDLGPVDASRCPAGQSECDGTCRDLQTDRIHCGRCGRGCATGERCEAGACEISCPGGQVPCMVEGGGRQCVTLQTDPAHCGRCGNACGAGLMCSVGVCMASCPPGREACTVAGVTRCADLATDGTHCGRCGNACGAGEMCQRGVCARPCPGTQTPCGGSCRDLATDPANCGVCGLACPAGFTCADGRCARVCPAGQTNCAGVCVDLRSDTANCGTCNLACPRGESCVASRCELVCAGTQRACGGVCREVQTDVAHCGACGNECPPGSPCVGGRCMASCPAGQTFCGGSCVNATTDVAHCGVCFHACAMGENCRGGMCVLGGDRGRSFRIASLTASGCRSVEHGGVTGDDRGGIAVSTRNVFYTGDGSTGRFDLETLSASSTGRQYDALTGNLRDGTVYTLASGSSPLPNGGGTVTALLEIDGNTGAPTGRSVPLSMPVTARSITGIFAGWDRVVLHNGARVYDIELPSGRVVDLGPMATPTHAGCESWAYWGTAEAFGGDLYIDLVRDSSSIVRVRVPDGSTSVLASFSSLSDMCSFTVSVPTGRWYWHHEGGSQFRSGDESIGYCSASFAMP